MTDDAAGPAHPPAENQLLIQACIPAEWETDVLEDHVAQIVFDPYSSYRPDCALCRRAAAAGLFAIVDGLSPTGPRAGSRFRIPESWLGADLTAGVDDNGTKTAVNPGRPEACETPVVDGVAIESSKWHAGRQAR